jgi:hypothetical protein
MRRVFLRVGGAMVVTGVVATLLSACSLGGLGGEAKAVADACSKVPGATATSCECYARELQNKLKPEQMTVAAAAQTNPGKLFDPKIIGNLSANDVMAVTNAMGAALKTCKITS